MLRARRTTWLAWLLPFIAARALIPVGFMPAVQHGALTMVLCGPQVLSPAPAHHHHASLPGTHFHTHGSGHECPFAQSAGPALAMLAPSPASMPATHAPLPLLGDSVAPRRIPYRHQAPRGPPVAV